VPTPVETLLVKSEKQDPTVQLLQARIDRHTAKLDKWAAELNAKRSALNTPLKVAAFKEEEAKYQLAVTEARDTAEALRKSGVASGDVNIPTLTSELAAPREDEYFESGRTEVFTEGAAVCVLQGRTFRILDRANGRLTKEVPLAGGYRKAIRGAGCLYVIGGAGPAGVAIARIGLADGSVTAINVAAAPAGARYSAFDRTSANVEAQRTEFTAYGAELLQLDARLLEKKVTERQALKGDTTSDWEAADKNGKGGWGGDAALIADAMANDAARDATGGKEYVDESTYEGRPAAAVQ
jgi:hypothetical protein